MNGWFFHRAKKTNSFSPQAISIVAGHLQDIRLLGASLAYEQASPWEAVAPVDRLLT